MTGKKRVLLLIGFFFALLLLSAAPAAEAAGHEHDAVLFQAWTSGTSLPGTTGDYYLTKNVVLSERWEVTGTVRICLDGYSITQGGTKKPVIKVASGASLTVYDCDGGGEITGGGDLAGVIVEGLFTMKGGSVTENRGNYGGILVENGGLAELLGGEVYRNGGAPNSSGGGVYVLGSGSKLTVNGAVIYANSAVYGGGVYVASGSEATLLAGSISENSASAIGGGGVYVGTGGVFRMKGGEVAGNLALDAGDGGGVYNLGTFDMEGGVLRYNEAEGKGGGIFNRGTLRITGGEISENNAGSGGGIYADKAFSAANTRIQANRAIEEGGGVYMASGSPSVSGRVKITGNHLWDGDEDQEYSNLWLANDNQVVVVTGNMDEDSEICLSAASLPGGTSMRVLTSGLRAKGGISDPERILSCDRWREYGVAWNPAESEAVAMMKPKCTSLPKDVSVKEGEKATFAVAVTGVYVTCQWEYSTDGGETWKTWAGKTSWTVTVTATAKNDGCLYRVEITNPVGQFHTAPAKLTTLSLPEITKQPQSIITAAGKTATFRVTASGKELTYQWQYRPAGSTAWKTWTGKTAASVTVTAGTGNNGCSYRVTVKNGAGSVTSAEVTLILLAAPKITTQPKNQTVAQGKSVTFKV
ncbi:MAG: hypothetical protein II776_00785, partial [Clostridia bacterium]|nr:hypothetical protein [Clostridia bacterium]